MRHDLRSTFRYRARLLSIEVAEVIVNERMGPDVLSGCFPSDKGENER